MGQPFAAGTTDGPGIDGAFQGRGPAKTTLKVLSFLANTILDITSLPDASKELKDCQFPKTILLATGEFTIPYKWQASVVPLQLFVLGRKFVILAQPSEITTMAGRRLQKSVKDALVADNVVDSDARVVIAGLANMYTSYVTTLEEYSNQRYEGGSTIFGPYTLLGYQSKFSELAKTFKLTAPKEALEKLSGGARVDAEGDYSEFRLNNQVINRVILDDTPTSIKKWNWKCFCFEPGFGTVKEDVPKEVRKGERVKAVFHCAHPRNQPTFAKYMAIERKDSSTE
jgi:neutral ceramidase